MLFGFRFLKQVWFGEHSIAMHQESTAQRLEKDQAKLQQLEAEAHAQLAEKTEDMYEQDDE